MQRKQLISPVSLPIPQNIKAEILLTINLEPIFSCLRIKSPAITAIYVYNGAKLKVGQKFVSSQMTFHT